MAKKIAKELSLEEQELFFLRAANAEREALAEVEGELGKLLDYNAELRRLLAEAKEYEALAERIGRLKATAAPLPGMAHQAAGAMIEARRDRSEMKEAVAVLKAQAKAPSPLASTLVDGHMADRLADGKRPHAVRQERGTLRRFFEICGDRPVSNYSRADINQFINTMRTMPAVYGKRPGDADRTAQELIAAADKSEKPVPRMADKTIKRHVSALTAFFSSAVTQGHVLATDRHDSLAGHKFRIKKKSKHRRMPWRTEDLVKLFQSPVWTGCHQFFRTRPGPHVIRDARFWLPLLCLFQGARLEELADLYRRDVIREGDIWAIRIQTMPEEDGQEDDDEEDEDGDEEGRDLKNENAHRVIPIHPEILRIGFIQYVQATAPNRDDPLFPELEKQGLDQRRGPRFARWFIEYRRSVKVYRKGVGSHSMRHGAITRLSDCITNYAQKRQRDYMMGHAPNEVLTSATEGDVTYDKGPGLRMCADTLALLQYPELDFSHLYV